MTRKGISIALVVLLSSASFASEDLSFLQVAFLRGEYDKVMAGTQRLLQRGDPNETEQLLYLQGISALKLRDLEISRESLTRLLTEYPNSRLAPQAWMAWAESFDSKGNYEKAAQIYRELLSREQGKAVFPQASFRLGLLQRTLGLWGEARESFRSVIQKAPNSLQGIQAREILEMEDFHFSVQVGAFGNLANAQRLKEELQRRGYEPTITPTILEARRFHRVRVGRFARREEAQELAQQLNREGFPARVVP